MRGLLVLALLGLVAAAPVDPDWPCVQRLVPALTAATLWSGPAPQQDWRANAEVVGLVEKVADRRVKVEDAVAKLRLFVATQPSAEARAELFNGLVERSNVDRAVSIDRLRQVSRRLRALSEAITAATHEVDALPAAAQADARNDVVSRRALLLRQYDDLSRTIRYACEIPVDFEQRLGQFARVLQ